VGVWLVEGQVSYYCASASFTAYSTVFMQGGLPYITNPCISGVQCSHRFSTTISSSGTFPLILFFRYTGTATIQLNSTTSLRSNLVTTRIGENIF
jgi:hypothetical protein